jgi:twitching motility protein PilT
LYLITGGPSCGKSSTLASVVQEWVSSSDYHIRVLEDPIEYDYKPGSGLLTQQWVHKDGDIPTYKDAIDDCLRQDVNIVAFGELRDVESIKQALFASTLNMVVIATIHAPDFVGAIQRILEAFPPSDREGVLRTLQTSLKVVISQRFIVNSNSLNSGGLNKKSRAIGDAIKLDYESVVVDDDIAELLTATNYINIPELHLKKCKDFASGNNQFDKQ